MADDWRKQLRSFKPLSSSPPPPPDDEDEDEDEDEQPPSMAELLGETGARRPPPRRGGTAPRGPSPLDFDDMPDMEALLAAEAPAKPASAPQPRPTTKPRPPSESLVDTADMPAMDELLEEAVFPTVRGTIVDRTDTAYVVAVGPARHLEVPLTEAEEDDLQLGDELLIEERRSGPVVRKSFRRERERLSAPTVADVPLRGRGFVIDGSNVCRGTAGPGASSALGPLLALVCELRGRGADAICVFDANEGYELAGNPAEPNAPALYETLLREQSRHFVEAPGASSADETVLRIADRRGWRIISNDRFNKADDLWPGQYPWLRFGSARLLPWTASDNRVTVPDLQLTAAAGADLRALVEALSNR